MLSAIKRFFQERVLDEAAKPAADAGPHALRLAAAALLFEVMRADAEVRDEERTVMRTAIQGTFGLTREETEELMRLAEDASRQAVSLYEFTSLVDKGFDAEQKKRVVELMWLVTFADGEKDALEEHLIRKVAGLLHVPHPDFIDAKLRARSTREGGSSEPTA
jgi:uncharacterized tellurite resistance protein B-like protein